MSIIVLGKPGENEFQTSLEAPAWFKAKLKQYDSRLYVQWNKRKERWVLEECTEHHPEGTDWHTHLCRRDLFFMLQEEDGSPIYLEDSRIFDHFLPKFNILTRFGGADGLIDKMNEIDRCNVEKERRGVHEQIQNMKKDNKKSLEEAITLIDRHDIWRPHS